MFEILINVQVREIVDVMEEKRVHKGSFVIREGWYHSFIQNFGGIERNNKMSFSEPTYNGILQMSSFLV